MRARAPQCKCTHVCKLLLLFILFMQASTNAPQAIHYYHYYYSSKAGSDPSNKCSMCANHGDFHFHTTKIPRFFPTWNLNMEWHKGHFLGQKVRWCRRSYDIHERLERGAVILNSIKRALSRIPNSSINCICCISKYLIPTTAAHTAFSLPQNWSRYLRPEQTQLRWPFTKGLNINNLYLPV